jgi:hypothetical protein
MGTICPSFSSRRTDKVSTTTADKETLAGKLEPLSKNIFRVAARRLCP